MSIIKKIFFMVLGFVFFTATVAYAAVKDDPIMIKGIRPMGMGGAFTAVADDENAFFYNPAGIAQRKGYLFQIFNVNAAVNTNTINFGKDLNNVLKDLDKSDKQIDALINLKDNIADKDIDFAASVFNPAYISKPYSIGSKGNTLSFGIGLFDSVNVAVKAGMEIPRFMLEFAKLSQGQILNNETSFVNAISDDMLNEAGILQPGKSVSDVRNAIAQGQSWTYISSSFLTTDLVNLIDNIQTIAASSMNDGDKYAAIANELSSFKGGIWNIDNTSAKATVNAYASATFDIPVAYKFKSLDALRLPGELSIGANLKYINRAKFSQTVTVNNSEIEKILNGMNFEDAIDTKVGAAYGQGFGLDLGMMYSLNPRVHFGLQISDLFTNIDYNKGYSLNKDKYSDSEFTHSAYIATQFNIGASYIPKSIFGWNTKNRLLLAADIRDIFSSYEDSFKNKLHLGAEYRLGCLALRAGLNKLRPAAGLGLEFSWFQLSYAYYGEESHLSKILNDSDETVYYHEFQLAFKVGHLKGRKVEEVKTEKAKPVVSENTGVAEQTIKAVEPVKTEKDKSFLETESKVEVAQEEIKAAETSNENNNTKGEVK